jgi:hypothetical protein
LAIQPIITLILQDLANGDKEAMSLFQGQQVSGFIQNFTRQTPEVIRSRQENGKSKGARLSLTAMVFTKRFREGVRRGFITCSVRIWKSPRVKVGGRYPMDEGEIVIDSLDLISLQDITYDLAVESGFESRADLLNVARHGSGENVYLVRFHYSFSVPSPPGEDRKQVRRTPGNQSKGM